MAGARRSRLYLRQMLATASEETNTCKSRHVCVHQSRLVGSRKVHWAAGDLARFYSSRLKMQCELTAAPFQRRRAEIRPSLFSVSGISRMNSSTNRNQTEERSIDRERGPGTLLYGKAKALEDVLQANSDKSSEEVDGEILDGDDETDDNRMDESSATDDESDPNESNVKDGDKTYERESGGGGMEFLEVDVEKLEADLKILELKAHPQDIRIGMACLRLAQVYDAAGENPQKILNYGLRALKIIDAVKESVQTSMCLQVIGSAYYKMSKYEKCIASLERAARILVKLEPVVGEWEVKALKHSLQILLGHAKMTLGFYQEALEHYRESLDINERLLEPGHPELGSSYQQVAEACMEAGDTEEALEMCTKALTIFQNHFGQESPQVASCRELLALIYGCLKDFEKVLEEHEKIRPILEAQGQTKEIISLNLSTSEALIALERQPEAIGILENIVKQTSESSPSHGHALIWLAKAHAAQKKCQDAITYCKKALDFLTANSTVSAVETGESLVELASIYEKVNELEQCIPVLRKALDIFEKYPDEEEAIADVESQIGSLLISLGRADEGLPHLERAVERSEEIYGPFSEELMSLYNQIAIANMQLKRPHDAEKMFEKAREIAHDILEPDDSDILAIYHNLVNACSEVGRFDKAIKYQRHIVESASSLGIEAVEEAEKRLSQLLQRKDLFEAKETMST